MTGTDKASVCTFCHVAKERHLIRCATDVAIFRYPSTINEFTIRDWPLAHEDCAVANSALAMECPKCNGIGRIGRDLTTMDLGEICDLCDSNGYLFLGEKISCPHCYGSGNLEGAYTPGYPGNLPTQECGYCRGEGKVPKGKVSAHH